MPAIIRLVGVLLLLFGLFAEAGILLMAAWQGSAATSAPPLQVREWLIVLGICFALALCVWLAMRALFRWADRIEMDRLN